MTTEEKKYRTPLESGTKPWKTGLLVFLLLAVSFTILLQGNIILHTIGLLLSAAGGWYIARLATKRDATENKATHHVTGDYTAEKTDTLIANALPDMIFIIDRNGRYIDFKSPDNYNPSIKAEQIVNRNVRDVFSEDLSDEVMSFLSRTLETRAVHDHNYQININDELRSYESRYVPLTKNEVMVLVRDITDAHRTEETEFSYRSLVERATDAIFIVNNRYKFLLINPAACELSQYSENELLQMRFDELVVGAEPGSKFSFEKIQPNETVILEKKMHQKDGGMVDVEISAKIIAPGRYMVFARDITERKKVESELLHSRENLRQLSNYIENIREQERLHIAREIHDVFGQQLTVLKMDMARIGKNLPTTAQKLSEDIQTVLLSVDNMVETVRKIASRLRPGLLDDLGLTEAMSWYCNDFEKRSGIKTNFVCNLSDEKFTKDITIGFFRILQESLTNVMRHAEATRVDVSFIRQDGYLTLLIEDDGKGFEHSVIRTKKTLGILGMQERAIMIGGFYKVDSAPGKGTVVELAAPFN
jgi:PAS domain S-box-containing protein